MKLKSGSNLFRLAMVVVMAALIMGAAQLAPGAAAANDLNINLNGSELWTYTYAELGSSPFTQYQYAYSSLNTYGDGIPKDYVAEGPALEQVLLDAFAKNTATDKTLGDVYTIAVYSSDGKGEMTFMVDQLFDEELTLYSYINNPSGYAVRTILALWSASGTNFGDMTATDRLRLMMGQRTPVEQNNVWMIKKINRIELSTFNPGEWDMPTAQVVGTTEDITSGTTVSVSSGTEVTLSQESADLTESNNIGTKIYYTLDGNDPTVDSEMYNVSAWAENQPITIAGTIGDTVILKAIVIGPGFANSDIATFYFNIVQ